MKMSKTNDEAEVIDVLVVANDDNHEDGTGNANEETPPVFTRRRANMNCRYCAPEPCAVDVWGDTLGTIMSEVNEEVEVMGGSCANNTSRKAVYRRQALQGAVSYHAPKNRTYCQTVSLYSRVSHVAGIHNWGVERYFSTMMETLGIDLPETSLKIFARVQT